MNLRGIFVLLLLAMMQNVANAQEHELTVSDVRNSGCLGQTRGAEDATLPTIVLKKEGTDVLVELQNYVSNCGTESFDVTLSVEKGWSGASYSDSVAINVASVVPYAMDCTCPFNVSFKVHGVEGNTFYLTCWWFDGLVELTEGEPWVLSNETENVLIDGSRYVLKKGLYQALIRRYSSDAKDEFRIPEETSYQDETYKVTGIYYDAFFENRVMKKIIIHPAIKVLSSGISGGTFVNPFYTCKALESIEVEAGNAVAQSVDGVMFDKKMTALLAYPAGSTRTSYEVPEGVTTLESHAFANSPRLNTITIPNGVKSIGAQAFADCTSLKSLDIPESVNKIELLAFNGTKMNELYIRGVIDSAYVSPNPYVSMFSGMSTNTKLYVLPSEVEKFKAIYNGPVYPITSGDTEGISEVETLPASAEKTFDLQGRRIQGEPKHGVYIQDGKKVMK